MKKDAGAILIGLIMIGVVIVANPFNTTSNMMAEAQSTKQSISMPVEYINYIVYNVHGRPWASVDGTYPMEITPSLVGQELQMLYPMPSGVTNISVEVNGQKLSYSNLTQSYPDILHDTYLGEWQIILFTIQSSSTDFNLTLDYQHPILKENGTYMFLYNLNISPYLSNPYSESTAYFNVRFNINCSGINVYSVAGEGSLNNGTKTPVSFTIIKNNGIQTVEFNIVSDYNEPPHDELITFNESQNQVLQFPSLTISIIILVLVVAAASLLRALRTQEHESEN